jgi:hypothetical protein
MGLDVAAGIDVGVDVDVIGDIADLQEEPRTELRSVAGLHVRAEVGQRTPFLLGHVVAVGSASLDDGAPPAIGPHGFTAGGSHGGADLVVVPDGITRLVGTARPDRQKLRVEASFLGGGMPIERIGEPRPQSLEAAGRVTAQVVELGEATAELTVLIQDDGADVRHGDLPLRALRPVGYPDRHRLMRR